MSGWLSDPDHLAGVLLVILAVLWLAVGTIAALGVGRAFADGENPE